MDYYVYRGEQIAFTAEQIEPPWHAQLRVLASLRVVTRLTIASA